MMLIKNKVRNTTRKINEKLNIKSKGLPEKRKSGRLLKNVGPKEKKRLIG